MTMQESIISIQKLSHRYSAQWAIRDINLEIRKNGIYGLLGSNGAGKINNDEHPVRSFATDGRKRFYPRY